VSILKLLEEAIAFASSLPDDLNLDSRRTRNKSAIQVSYSPYYLLIALIQSENLRLSIRTIFQEGFDKETTLGILDAARDMIARKSRGFAAPLAIVEGAV